MPCPQGRVGSNPTSGIALRAETGWGRGANQRFWSLRIAVAARSNQNPDERLRRLAIRQHGVISRAQLLRLGLTPSSISHRRRRGWLFLLHCRVYAVGRPDPDGYGRWMAAVLACGRDALLSHQSAAELWEIRSPQSGP